MNIPKLQEIAARIAVVSPADEADKIRDERFIDQLREVQNLKRFLFEEKVKFDPSQFGSIDLGPLNNLRFGATGRMATLEEWALLDEKISILAAYLNDDLRQKIRIRELSVFFGTVPLAFLLAALLNIVFFFLYPTIFVKDTFLFHAAYLLSLIGWSVAQGGLGACAYLGTRAAIKRAEKEPRESPADSADITDKNILKIRIILGCLFGAVIGLPIANPALDKLGKAIYADKLILEPSDFALMILPFLIGFSTNLVLAILERCVDSIRTFFGISAK